MATVKINEHGTPEIMLGVVGAKHDIYKHRLCIMCTTCDVKKDGAI